MTGDFSQATDPFSLFQSWFDEAKASEINDPNAMAVATVDAEGCVWHTMVATGHLVRLDPKGRVDRVIQLPVTNPTCPAFGGKGLRTLYVTSHSQRIAPERLAAEPWAGALLSLDVGVAGLPEPRYQG